LHIVVVFICSYPGNKDLWITVVFIELAFFLGVQA